MNVLIVGGYKGPILEKAVRPKFEGTPVKLSVEQYIDGTMEAISKGESYHRIVILEFGWNRDGDIKDEELLRHRLYEFNECYLENRLEGTEIVFVTDTPESANMVYEETLQIQENTAIHCLQKEISVKMAKMLMVGDLSALDNTEEVFKLLDEKEVEEQGLVSEEFKPAEVKEEEFTGFDDIEDLDLGDDGEFTGFEEGDLEIEEEGLSSAFDGFDSFDADDFSGFGEDDGEEIEDVEEEEIEEEIEEELEEEIEEEIEEEVEEDVESEFKGFEESEFTGFDEIEDLEVDELGDFGGFGTESKEPEVFNDEKKDPFLHFVGDGIGGDEEEPAEVKGFDEMEDELFGYDEEEGFEDENYKEPEVYVAPVKSVVAEDDDYEASPEFSENGTIDLGEYQNARGVKRRKGQKEINYAEMKIKLDAYASRGTSIAVTGSAASGKTFVAYNLANILNKMGYNVLLVDFDLHGRGQSYITKENYKSVEIDGTGVIQALKNANKASAFVSIARPGLSVLTNGVGGTPADLDKIVTNENLLRFISTVKSTYSYVIYDIPFEKAVGSVKEVLYSADDVLMVTEGSQYGIAKTILNMGNIEDLDLMEALFTKSKLVLNKIESDYRIFGKKIKKVWDYLKVMDEQLGEWSGEWGSQYFQALDIVGVLQKDPLVEKAWFTNSPYSGKEPGRGVFVQLLWNLL